MEYLSKVDVFQYLANITAIDFTAAQVCQKLYFLPTEHLNKHFLFGLASLTTRIVVYVLARLIEQNLVTQYFFSIRNCQRNYHVKLV